MISKTAEYALRAVVCLAKGTVSADRLAEDTKVPRRYLQRVLQDLAAAGIVRSKSGPGGGYDLEQQPSRLSLLVVINAVAPLERIKQCPLGISSHLKLCPLHAELDRAYAATEKAFAKVTIAELVNSSRMIAPLCDQAHAERRINKIKMMIASSD